MLMKTNERVQVGSPQARAIYIAFVFALCLAVCVVVFNESLLELVRRWQVQEEYSHGFLIPVIVAWLLWSRRDALLASIGEPSWFGPALILVAAAMQVVG